MVANVDGRMRESERRAVASCERLRGFSPKISRRTVSASPRCGLRQSGNLPLPRHADPDVHSGSARTDPWPALRPQSGALRWRASVCRERSGRRPRRACSTARCWARALLACPAFRDEARCSVDGTGARRLRVRPRFLPGNRSGGRSEPVLAVGTKNASFPCECGSSATSANEDRALVAGATLEPRGILSRQPSSASPPLTPGCLPPPARLFSQHTDGVHGYRRSCRSPWSAASPNPAPPRTPLASPVAIARTIPVCTRFGLQHGRGGHQK